MGLIDFLNMNRRFDRIDAALAEIRDTQIGDGAIIGDMADQVDDIYDALFDDDPEPPDPDEHPDIDWEPYLDTINVQADLLEGARYQLVAVWHTENGQGEDVPDYAKQYVPFNGCGGETHAFALVFNKDGTPLAGKTVLMSWPGGETGATTWDDGSCNFFTNGVYYPDKGQTGPYCVEVLNGDRYCGAGLPYGQHISIVGVWREREDYQPSVEEQLFAAQNVAVEVPFTMIVGKNVEV